MPIWSSPASLFPSFIGWCILCFFGHSCALVTLPVCLCHDVWASDVYCLQMSLNARQRDGNNIKKKEEREQLKWKAAGHVGLDLQIKKASEQAKQFSPLLPPCLPRLPSPSFTLLSPWTADWHSVEDSPGWRLKEVKLICELKRECSRGHRVEGVGMCWW